MRSPVPALTGQLWHGVSTASVYTCLLDGFVWLMAGATWDSLCKYLEKSNLLGVDPHHIYGVHGAESGKWHDLL